MFNKRIRFVGQKEIKAQERGRTENVISRRFYIVMGVVVAVALIYALRLFTLQISNQDYYTAKLDNYATGTFTIDALRGEIVDCEYNKIVYNENVVCATYYAVKNIKDEEIDAMVNFLVENCDIDISDVTKREKKDYLIMKDPKYVKSLITDEENEAMKDKDDYDTLYYNLELKRITDDILEEKLSDDDVRYWKLYYAISTTTSGYTVLLEDISVKEASLIGENKDLLRGVSVTSDWKRTTATDTLSNVVGSVTTKKQGLPATYSDQLLALDYSNDSRVGTSGLEAYYENTLKGTGSTYEVEYDSDGNPSVSKVASGESGENLRLAIDLELQEKIGKYAEKQLKENSFEPYMKHLNVMLVKPDTGEIVVMVGKRRGSDGKIYDDDAGCYRDAYEIGSTMKAAVLYTCFKNNVIEANHYEVDDASGIQLKDTKTKHSWNMVGWGSINEVTAMAYSSNIYMMKIIIKLAGGKYVKGGTLNFTKDGFALLRNGAGELGLGVKTQIDVPSETLGYRGSNAQPGNLLDFAIGQYDTYSTAQLASYVVCLANMGKRVRIHLMKDTYVDDSEGNHVTVHQFKKQLLDDVSDEETAFKQIRKGMRAVVTFGTVHKGFSGYPYRVAGKTGTADKYAGGTSYPNHIFIGYADYEDPQICVVVFVQRQLTNNAGPSTARYAMSAYFEKYGYTNPSD